METARRHRYMKNMIASGFTLNVIIGFCGSFITSPGLQHFFWALSAFFMIIAASLLSSKLTRDGHDIPAAGFIIISIAEAMSYGFIATHDAGSEQFGAVISIFIPGLVLISFYDVVPWLIRIPGFLAAIFFAALAVSIYREADPDVNKSLLTFASYATMNAAFIGWAWLIFKNKI